MSIDLPVGDSLFSFILITCIATSFRVWFSESFWQNVRERIKEKKKENKKYIQRRQIIFINYFILAFKDLFI